MKRRALLGIAVGLFLIAAPGCRRSVVKDEKTFDLATGDVYVLTIPACKKFEVTYTTKDSVPVSAYVMSKADGDESISAKSVKGKKLATQDSTANGRLVYEPKEKVEMAVVFECKLKTSVSAKISGE